MDLRLPYMLTAGLLLAGCVSHEARVLAPPEPAGLTGATVIGGEAHPTPPGPGERTVARDALPREVAVSAWRRDGDGAISRQETVVRTPLAWWQRFPIDIATDLIPIDCTASAETTLAPRPVATRTRADLDREAAAAGYAHP